MEGRFPFSNFEACQVRLGEMIYPTTEHAYQAAKTDDPMERQAIALAGTPGEAKRMGRKITLRPDWETVKVGVMQGLLIQKYTRDPFRARLSESEGPLVEWNTWHDNIWGDCTCGRPSCQAPGKNYLGRLLSNIRIGLQEGAL